MVDISNMTTKELWALKAEIDKALEAQSETEKKTLWEEFKNKAADIGTSAQGIFEWATSKKQPVKNPVPPKYRSVSGETWSGRGNPPKWLAELEKAGHPRSEYLIDKPKDPPTPRVTELRKGAPRKAAPKGGRK